MKGQKEERKNGRGVTVDKLGEHSLESRVTGDCSTGLSSSLQKSASPSFNDNVEVSSYQYTALTKQAMVQLEHQETSASNDQAHMPLRHFEASSVHPYQRYSTYDPIIQQTSSAACQPAGEQQPITSYPHTNTLSYASTPLHTVTPSHTSASSVLDQSTSSTHAEYEQYTCTQDVPRNAHGSIPKWGNDLAGVGAQFVLSPQIVKGTEAIHVGRVIDKTCNVT